AFDAAAAGPGLGTAAGTVEVLRELLAADLPVVFDADALTVLAGRLRVFWRRKAATVLTPHPGEAGRLLRVRSSRVQRDRRDAARRLSRGSGAVVVLKGAASLIADPSGGITVNPTGTPLMATAGSGDVLTGCVGALLAPGLEADRSAVAAASLHGLAGEPLSRGPSAPWLPPPSPP